MELNEPMDMTAPSCGCKKDFLDLWVAVRTLGSSYVVGICGLR